MNIIRVINQDQIPSTDNYEDFIEALAKPTWIWIKGKDPTRTRVLTTLLHGNEPSGLRALVQWLKEGIQPVTTMGIFIGSIEASLRPPKFSHRYLPEGEDLNRAFAPPFDTPTRQLAQSLMDLIRSAEPEALIDLHNTSGSSVGFAICVKELMVNEALASLFTSRLIVADLNLNSLMEFASDVCPCVTIECGGIQDRLSDITALEGIKHYWLRANISQPLPGQKIQKIYNPLRFEIKEGHTIGFSSSIVPDWDITLPTDVEQYNYKTLQPEQPLGWLGQKGLSSLQVINSDQMNLVDEFFCEKDNQLFAKKPLRLFMVTTNPKIAQADCLFYLVVHQEPLK